jgi:hypothetical protein
MLCLIFALKLPQTKSQKMGFTAVVRAHTTTPKRRGPNAEKRLVPNRNKTEQLETEPSRKIGFIWTKLASSETEFH